MKRFGKRKLRLTMQLKAFKNGQVIYHATKRKKTAILKEISVLQPQNPDMWILRVVYGREITEDGSIQIFDNTGEYNNPADLLYALKLFLEKELLIEQNHG